MIAFTEAHHPDHDHQHGPNCPRRRKTRHSVRSFQVLNWEPSARQRGGNARKRQHRFSTLSTLR
jgi:hypothetical protein